jgi:FkbM family methyltransferase
MSIKHAIRFNYIKFNRYILKRKFIRIFDGPLKGYKWSTRYNYEYLIGDYEDPETMKIICSWFKDDSVFYDLGANVGYYSFIANQYITKGAIYSFEPIPYNIAVFKEHMELNKKKIKHHTIHLLPYAISSKEGEIAFSHDPFLIEGNTYIKSSSTYSNSQQTITVKCYSIDGLLQSGYKKPDIIKIDVEGAEYDVLLGAAATLKKFKPNILLATHDCHLPGVQQNCKNFLQEMGYKLTQLSRHNKYVDGLEDYIAIHTDNIEPHGRA